MTDNPNHGNVRTENINTMKLKNMERKHLFFVQTQLKTETHLEPSQISKM